MNDLSAAIRVRLAAAAAFVSARLREPSTYAGMSAFLVAVAGGLAATHSRRDALVLLGAAAAAGLRAMLTADPVLSARATQVLAAEGVAAPVLAGVLEAALPQHAARIATLETQIQRLAVQLQAVAPGGSPAAGNSEG